VNILGLINRPFKFEARPTPIPGDLRPDWRVALILLILAHSRRNTASLEKLNVIGFAARSAPNRQSLLAVAKGELSTKGILIRFEPALMRALDLAIGEGLVQLVRKNRYQLTEKGEKLSSKIASTQHVFEAEKDFIRGICRYMTEMNVQSILRVREVS
jgi:hypothetical protein